MYQLTDLGQKSKPSVSVFSISGLQGCGCLCPHLETQLGKGLLPVPVEVSSLQL